jgi:predicted TIM-barrel fold metal-dependent hydrolase
VQHDDKRTRSVYNLISADSHVNEPPDLWVSRVSKKYKDRAPRIERFEKGDAWVLEGVEDPINFGLNACAGMLPAQRRAWLPFEELRRGGWDPKARLDEMDEDDVDAEVLYPTPRLAQSIFANTDPGFQVEMVRAYNDWISEYAEYAPDRFGALALLPNRGAQLAVDEFVRVQGRPGVRGVVVGSFPNGTVEVEPEDDLLWAALADAHVPLAIHVSLSQAMPSALRSPLPGAGRNYDAPNRLLQMIFAGVFDRFPELEVVFAEVDCGWVPYYKEQIDNNFRRLSTASDFKIKGMPSSYVERHAHFAYITDTFGIDNRHAIGIDRILWSSDYPHIAADWPYTWRGIMATFTGVPNAERDQILAGNTARLYGFGNGSSYRAKPSA